MFVLVKYYHCSEHGIILLQVAAKTTEVWGSSSAVSPARHFLAPSLAPGASPRGRETTPTPHTPVWQLSGLPLSELHRFQLSRDSPPIRRKVLTGPSGGFKNPSSYSQAGAHPLWEVAKPPCLSRELCSRPNHVSATTFSSHRRETF